MDQTRGESHTSNRESIFLTVCFFAQLKETESPCVIRMISRFNQVSMWVASEIVSEHDYRKRVDLVEHFIRIGTVSLAGESSESSERT